MCCQEVEELFFVCGPIFNLMTNCLGSEVYILHIMLPFTNRETRQHFKVFYSDFPCYVDYDVLCFVCTFIFNLDLIKICLPYATFTSRLRYVHKHCNVANFARFLRMSKCHILYAISFSI